jgi:mono/diheme cytochrome c family protein
VPLDAAGKPLGGLTQSPLPANPLSMSAATLARGRERFEIFCAPCHGPLGDGDGLVARRGFPHPPSYHSERLRNAPDAHFFGVITHGYGAMYPYADRIAPADRWAIVAYIRALQRSQHASLADVPETERKRLEAQR